jgi:hypothetical protein
LGESKKMNLKSAFLISYYDVIDDETISIKGRVLLDISLKDKLLYIVGNEKSYYIVKKIIAYKHEFDIINAGMTCELVVIGENKNFKEEYLYLA